MTSIAVDQGSDRALAARVLEDGDEAAFRMLYRRHTAAVYGLVLRLLGGDAEDAEDVVQDAWLRAVQGLGRFRWEAAFRTWLTGIALNRAREVLRRRALRDGSGPHVEAAELAVVVAARPGERLDLERAIAALPDGYRTVLVLHDVEGFTHPEIGERLDISVGTSRSQLFRARRTLRRLLEPETRQEATS